MATRHQSVTDNQQPTIPQPAPKTCGLSGYMENTQNEIIDKIAAAKPNLAAMARNAQSGNKQALKALADNACMIGGAYLKPLEWLEVSKWGI